MADLDLAVDAYLGEQKDQAVSGLKLSVSNALAINPDQEAQARKAASTLSIPVDAARDNLAEAQQRAFMQQTDFGMLSDRFPKTAGFMAQQENANIAHDDLDNLSGIETAFDALKNLGRAGVSGLRSASGGVVGAVRAPFELAAPLVDPLVGRVLPNNPLRQTAAGLARYQADIAQTAAAEMPKGEGIVSQGIYSGVGSLSRNLASLPLIFYRAAKVPRLPAWWPRCSAKNTARRVAKALILHKRRCTAHPKPLSNTPRKKSRCRG